MTKEEWRDSIRHSILEGSTFAFCSETLATIGKDFIRELGNRIVWNRIGMQTIKEIYGEQFYDELFKGTEEEEDYLEWERNV